MPTTYVASRVKTGTGLSFASLWPLLSVIMAVQGCRCMSNEAIEPPGQPPTIVAQPVISLLGQPLPPQRLTEPARQTALENLAQAQRDLVADPDDERAIIWLGRRLAYLGEYHEAIEVFSDGLKKHPDSYHLLRHRGHRLITTRQIDRAVADLKRAAELAKDQPDEVEPDGAPNQYNIPTSTIQTNIWYHMGLAHYLQGDFDEAAAAYERCLAWCRNDDIKVATLYWLYLSAKRDGNESLAAKALNAAGEENGVLNLLENEDYYSLLKLFRGELRVNDLWTPAEAGSDESSRKTRVESSKTTNAAVRAPHPPPTPPSEGGGSIPTVSDTTLAYGVAMHYYLNGDRDTAYKMFENILATGFWPAFGSIAAEAELARRSESR